MQQKLDGERATATQEEKESTFSFLCASFVPFILTNKIPVIPNKVPPSPSSLHFPRSFLHNSQKKHNFHPYDPHPTNTQQTGCSSLPLVRFAHITFDCSHFKQVKSVTHRLAAYTHSGNTHTGAYLLAITTQPERSNSHPHPHPRPSPPSVIAPFLVERSNNTTPNLKSQSEPSTVALILTCRKPIPVVAHLVLPSALRSPSAAVHTLTSTLLSVVPPYTMTNSTVAVGRRPTDWNDFYKNGLPKEIIVIDDDTPPPPSLSSSSTSTSSSASAHHPAANGSSQRYHVIQPQMHPAYVHSAMPTSQAGAGSIQATTARVTRRTNKRQPSSDLISSGSNGGQSSISNVHYAYPDQYSNGQQQRNYPHSGPIYGNHNNQPTQQSSHAGPSTNAIPPAKKKRRSNAEIKQAQQQQGGQENHPVYYLPAPANLANPPPVNRDAPINVPPWDDKEGHYIVTPDDDFTSRYKIIRLLGQGTFGKVVECFDRESGRYCAIKIIRAVQKYRDASKIEARVLTTLKKNDPRNSYKCLHLNDCFDYRNHVCMVFDLLGQSIYDWLKDNSFCPFPPNQVQYFARQLLTSVAFLHRLRLIHTDLKPENILLANGAYRQVPYKKTPTKMRRILMDPEIRLIDFGSATFQDEHHSTVVSTRHYRAPEIILGLGWSYPCDIWSIGCILVEFLTGEALFQTHDNLEHLAMMQAVLGPIPDKLIRATHKSAQKFFLHGRLDYPNDETKRNSRKYVKALKPLKDYVVPAGNRVENLQFAAELKDLLSLLLTYDPEKRITAAQALKHPYFSYIVDENGQITGKKASEPFHPPR